MYNLKLLIKRNITDNKKSENFRLKRLSGAAVTYNYFCENA